MRKAILVVSILSLSLVGCASNVPNNSYAYTPLPTYEKTISPTQAKGASDMSYENTHQDQTWLSPGKVQIGNYHAGARAEWNIRLHNGDSSFIEKKMVTTDPNESSVTLKLKRMLYGDVSGVIFTSDNTNDKFVASGYDSNTQELTIGGFAAEQTRIMSIEYPYSAKYTVYYKEPTTLTAEYSMPPNEAQDWIIIDDSSIVLAPRETREVPIIVEMPDGKQAPKKWEFWVAVVEDVPKSAGSSVNIELVSRWLVAMRG